MRNQQRDLFGKSVKAALAATALFSGSAGAGGIPKVQLDTVEVTGKQPLEEVPQSATQGYVSADQLAQRPISRNGELLEFVPGLIVTQHSGEGKANQYFLRGFNLDHGTDFYTEVDGLPVNMRTHGHGQGYADINYIIPELIGSLEYRKGTYYADVGDFAAAGSANLRYVDSLPTTLLKFTGGSHDYYNLLGAASPKVLGGDLLLGAQGTLYKGPFINDSHERKISTVARYNHGDEHEGFTLGFQGYYIQYFASDQIPLRAVKDHQIDLYGFEDPTDGGRVHRFSVNAEWRHQVGEGNWRVSAYALDYRLALYSNFTYFLDDPVNGDQFEQADSRQVYGLAARRYWSLPTPIPADVEVGVQSRFDHIDPVGLYKTKARERLRTVRQDQVDEGSISAYVSSKQKWTPWFRSQLGFRGDYYHFDVESDSPVNSGKRSASIGSPKVALIFGPWTKTEYYLNFGEGFHSNDARGVTLKLDPNDRFTPAESTPPLVKARGMEFGVTSAIVPKVKLAASLFSLRLASELVYGGDSGTSDVGPSSRRYGLEFSAYYKPLAWLAFDGDYSYSHARLSELNVGDGDRIPNALDNVYEVGLTVPDFHSFSAGIRVRHLGPAALIEDDSARSKSTTVVNTQVGYRFLRNYTATAEVLNILNTRRNDITYFYTSRLAGEPAEGVDDFHFHPVEPRLFRLSLTAEI